MTVPWPFSQWGLDIMGPFQTAVRQLKFLVVGIDYFTKWVEAEALATITEKNIRNFVWKNIIYRYEIPRVLVSDNRKQFNNNAFKDFYSKLGIKNHYSSPRKTILYCTNRYGQYISYQWPIYFVPVRTPVQKRWCFVPILIPAIPNLFQPYRVIYQVSAGN